MVDMIHILNQVAQAYSIFEAFACMSLGHFERKLQYHPPRQPNADSLAKQTHSTCLSVTLCTDREIKSKKPEKQAV